MIPRVVSMPRVRELTSVGTIGRLLSKVLLEEPLDLGDTGETTDKVNLKNI